MSNQDRANKQEPEGVSSYLFNGNWMEKDGIKWAFFGSDRDKESHHKVQEKEHTKNETVTKSEIKVPSDKISITDLARLRGGKRYDIETSGIPAYGILEPDTILSGRYKILERYKSLEKRDFYTAKDLRLEGPCIVKELKCNHFSDEEEDYYRKKFNEEAKLLATLSHPNLPKTIDYFTENGRYFMVIDYIKGIDLETYFENCYGQIEEGQILQWGINLCDILEYLHTQDPPVIHRDIKPSNLFIRERDWSVVLFNFGFATRSDRARTKQIGTSGYAPPEQLSGKAEPRSDIYSVGATLHYLLSGESPRMDGDFTALIANNFSASIDTDLIVRKALKTKIKDRYEDAKEMRKALRDASEKVKHSEEEGKKFFKKDTIKTIVHHFEELVQKIERKDKGRLLAIKEIGKLGDPRAFDILIPLLGDESASIRLSAISALANMKDKKAIPSLSKLLEDQNMEIRQKVIEAIESLSNKKLPPLMVVPKEER
ncbi:MAG: Serine/threonine-protein kinase B [bacterium ADurb.Bin363]|nr:MAG: Serine/threonine-protein kinase B [bacterium ADurb.Bin363]